MYGTSVSRVIEPWTAVEALSTGPSHDAPGLMRLGGGPTIVTATPSTLAAGIRWELKSGAAEPSDVSTPVSSASETLPAPVRDTR